MERSDPAVQPLLRIEALSTGYGKKQVLHGVGLTLGRGEAISILGHNGAGKSTILRSIFGLQRAWQGTVNFDGAPLGAAHSPSRAVALGMAMIPSERFVFPDLTVLDNLRLSARGLAAADREAGFETAHARFPILRQRGEQLAGAMSGGEQRMVSLAMALMRKPRLLLLDEPSLGLSPAIAEQVMALTRTLVDDGMSVVLVEQNIPAALSVASRVYVMRAGQILLEESARALEARGREGWWALF